MRYDARDAALYTYYKNGLELRSFDAIIKEYGLKAPSLLDLAESVRTADAGKVPHPRPEGAGLEAAALGFRQVAKDDDENIRLQFPLHDALYASASGAWNKAGVSNSRPEESDRTPPRIAGRE